jgi:hypothetical protein
MAIAREFLSTPVRHLYEVLQKNPAVNLKNIKQVIEAIRRIAEICVYGDQHDNMLLEYDE